MTLPRSAFDLLDPKRCGVDRSWIDEFGEYQWFYLRGFNECLSALKRAMPDAPPPDEPKGKQRRRGLTLNQVSKYIEAGIHLANRQWGHDFEGDDWKEIGSPQFYRAKRHKPVRWDKACLIVATLSEFAKSEAPGFDILKFEDPYFDRREGVEDAGRPQTFRLSICPAFFVPVAGESSQSFGVNWKDIAKHPHLADGTDFVEALLLHTHQRKPEVFKRLLDDGDPCTYRTVELLIDFLSKQKIVKGGICRQFENRTDDDRRRRKKKPNSNEELWFDINWRIKKKHMKTKFID